MSDKISSGQTPSKVLHIRNLPYETSQEELEDLSKQFGSLVKTKLNVGANRNQAFIEFPDINCAVNMVHHFMSSAEPAKVRPPRRPAPSARGPTPVRMVTPLPTCSACRLRSQQVRRSVSELHRWHATTELDQHSLCSARP